ncbi:MAG: LamG domain protein jellyroll fold domain protein [Armatimonadetes bacterium]|nr:LamG domain protein jellyroll fold domain protein [Armatimonadota bacterium]
MSLTISKLNFRPDQPGANLPLLLRRDEASLIPTFTRPAPDSEWAHYPVAYRVDVPNADQVFIEVTLHNPDDTPVETRIRAVGEGVLGQLDWLDVAVAAGASIPLKLRLEDTRLSQEGVDVREVTWNWQFERPTANGPQITTLGVSRLTVYTVLGEPGPPWVQLPNNSLELPWAAVLDYACRWARGARTVRAAADLISRQVYLLGRTPFPLAVPNPKPFLTYREADHFSNGEFFNSEEQLLYPGAFFCDLLLLRLRGADDGEGALNCSDCASIVSVFTNLLGGKLVQARIDGPPSTDPNARFETHPVLMLGDPPAGFRRMKFRFHEVALEAPHPPNQPPDPALLAWDACLAPDDDGNPAPPHVDATPVGLPLGHGAAPASYLARLAPAGSGLRVTGTKQRRLVPEPPQAATPEQLTRLFPKGPRAPEEWPRTPLPGLPFTRLISMLKLLLADRWQLEQWTSVARITWSDAIRMSWGRIGAPLGSAWVSVTLQDCRTARCANDLLWQTIHSIHTGPPPKFPGTELFGYVAFGDLERGFYVAFGRYLFQVVIPLGNPGLLRFIQDFIPRLPGVLLGLIVP